jgi:hypothetical protein
MYFKEINDNNKNEKKKKKNEKEKLNTLSNNGFTKS